jgi:hypothetical protein
MAGNWLHNWPGDCWFSLRLPALPCDLWTMQSHWCRCLFLSLARLCCCSPPVKCKPTLNCQLYPAAMLAHHMHVLACHVQDGVFREPIYVHVHVGTLPVYPIIYDVWFMSGYVYGVHVGMYIILWWCMACKWLFYPVHAGAYCLTPWMGGGGLTPISLLCTFSSQFHFGFVYSHLWWWWEIVFIFCHNSIQVTNHMEIDFKVIDLLCTQSSHFVIGSRRSS